MADMTKEERDEILDMAADYDIAPAEDAGQARRNRIKARALRLLAGELGGREREQGDPQIDNSYTGQIARLKDEIARLLAGEGEPVAVKALEWQGGVNLYWSDTPWGRYAVDAGRDMWRFRESGWCHGGKAAAQANYEARIRSALAPKES